MRKMSMAAIARQAAKIAKGGGGSRGAQGPRGPAGPAGETGAAGSAGVGVPTGGSTGQVLRKASGTNYDTEWATASAGEAFPVGSVFIAVVSTNPGTLLGYGTWSAFGAGRMLVGLDSGDTDFDTPEETGGTKSVTLTAAQSGLPSHTHAVTDPGHTHVLNAYPTATGASTGFTRDTSMSGTPANTGLSTNTATTGLTVDSVSAAAASEAHTNLPPYIVVYMWKRTA